MVLADVASRSKSEGSRRADVGGEEVGGAGAGMSGGKLKRGGRAGEQKTSSYFPAVGLYLTAGKKGKHSQGCGASQKTNPLICMKISYNYL